MPTPRLSLRLTARWFAAGHLARRFRFPVARSRGRFQLAQPGVDPEQGSETALGEMNRRLAAHEDATCKGFAAAERERRWAATSRRPHRRADRCRDNCPHRTLTTATASRSLVSWRDTAGCSARESPPMPAYRRPFASHASCRTLGTRASRARADDRVHAHGVPLRASASATDSGHGVRSRTSLVVRRQGSCRFRSGSGSGARLLSPGTATSQGVNQATVAELPHLVSVPLRWSGRLPRSWLDRRGRGPGRSPCFSSRCEIAFGFLRFIVQEIIRAREHAAV